MRDLVFILIFTILLQGYPALAQEKALSATIIDNQDVQTDIQNVRIYWEEKVGEAAFIPHEAINLPVRKGSTTVHVSLGTIRKIEVERKKELVIIRITLSTGKTGEFTPPMSFQVIGSSEFGEVRIPIEEVKTVTFK